MNRKGKDITHIAIHCSAGHGDIASMRRYWKSLGWKVDGYHIVVDYNGTLTQLVPFNTASNGVAGYNSKIINICYRGGVSKNNVNRAEDTRTLQQKEGILRAIRRALQWIEETGGDVSKIRIQGHRDFSPDKNGNGVIEPWERIKECPSFDAIPEYKNVIKEYLSSTKQDMEHVVQAGDTLYKIAQKYSTTVEDIKALNPAIGSNNIINVGQKLKIK